MGVSPKALDVADFQRQLALLLKSDIPLPESLAELAENLGGGNLKSVAKDIAKATSEGVKLSEAMGKHPSVFTRFHVRMVEAGEKSETLPEVLAEIAATSVANAKLARMARDIALYPAFATGFTFAVLFALLFFIVPDCVAVFEEMLEGEPLPYLTEKVIELSNPIVKHHVICLTALGLYAGFFVWLFSGSNRANRFFVGILKRVPGAGRIYRDLDMARLAATWSILMARDVPSNDALAVTAELMEDGKTANALRRVSAEAAKGEPLAFLLEKERSVSPMFPLTIRHVPEKALPEELGNLATLFRGRAAIATRKAGVTWEILILLSLWFFIGMVALSMALPLFGSVGPLGGG